MPLRCFILQIFSEVGSGGAFIGNLGMVNTSFSSTPRFSSSNSWLVVQNLKIARSRGFIFPEAFRLTLVKGIVRIKNVELRPLIKVRERKEKSFLIGRKVSTNQKQKR